MKLKGLTEGQVMTAYRRIQDKAVRVRLLEDIRSATDRERSRILALAYRIRKTSGKSIKMNDALAIAAYHVLGGEK